MARRLGVLLAGVVLALGLTAVPAAANPPSPTAFCKAGINAGSPAPPGTAWVIQSARVVQYEPTHLMVKCVRTWRPEPGNYFLQCTQFVTLWWNGLWTFGVLDCTRFHAPS